VISVKPFMSAGSPASPLSPLSPFGIVKLKVVVVPDVEAEAEAFVPAAPVVVVPTATVAAGP
jgi:hypothetical protein